MKLLGVFGLIYHFLMVDQCSLILFLCMREREREKKMLSLRDSLDILDVLLILTHIFNRKTYTSMTFKVMHTYVLTENSIQ